jgi:hypothetical protein
MLRKTATPSMQNNSLPHSRQFVFSNQANTTKSKDAHGDVGQDKRAKTRARIASRQPARSHIPMRAQPTDNKTPRSQNTPVAKRRTVQLTLWTNPIVKAEIQRIAKREGVSDSAVGAAFLEKALQQNADLEYGALLRPIIESAIQANLQTMSTRLALLLVRVAFASEQTRSLVTNILKRQPGLSSEALDDILDRSAEAAKSKITKKTPQLEELIAEVRDWLQATDNKTHA